MRIYIPSRPIRYAVIATHALRSALEDLEDKLEALDESEEEETKPKGRGSARKGSAKSKR